MKVLAIGAHFDDVELGCGGTLLKHRDRGDDISILVVTHSGYENPSKSHQRDPLSALKEGEKSAKILNAKLFSIQLQPLTLVPNEKLVIDMEEIVNQIKPDRVYTHQNEDSHADHAAVGFTSLRACRKIDEILLYRSNWYIIDNINQDNFYVDISSFLQEKLELLRIFESEMKNVNYSWIDFVKKQNIASGAKVGVEAAETFRTAKMFWK